MRCSIFTAGTDLGLVAATDFLRSGNSHQEDSPGGGRQLVVVVLLLHVKQEGPARPLPAGR